MRQPLRVMVNYWKRGAETPRIHSEGPGLPETQANVVLEERVVLLHDARPIATQLSVDREGFEMLHYPSRVVDFRDESELRVTYFSEIELLVKAKTGAARVLVFDPTLRTSAASGNDGSPLRPPVLRTHGDFTQHSAAQTVRDLLPAEADTLLQSRFAILQAWRPFGYPVESFPLAVADARSVPPEDLVIARRYYPGWVGEIYWAAYGPDHRWYWFPEMQPSEILLFKAWDSAVDGRARWTIHTAIELPVPVGSRPRQSIEIRALALF